MLLVMQSSTVALSNIYQDLFRKVNVNVEFYCALQQANMQIVYKYKYTEVKCIQFTTCIYLLYISYDLYSNVKPTCEFLKENNVYSLHNKKVYP